MKNKNPFQHHLDNEKALHKEFKQIESSHNTVGELITNAINLHELNPSVVERELKLPGDILTRLMNDECYINNFPVVLFKNLLVSLHIPFLQVESLMLPTFRKILSNETKDSIKKKPHGYQLWENEQSVIKYTDKLKDLMVPVNIKKNLLCPSCKKGELYTKNGYIWCKNEKCLAIFEKQDTED